MNCNRARELLPTLEDRELDPENERDLHRHLNECQLCEKEAIKLRLAWDLFKREYPAQIPPARLDIPPTEANSFSFRLSCVLIYIKKPAFALTFTAASLLLAPVIFRSRLAERDDGGKAPPYEMSSRAAVDIPELRIRVPGVPETLEAVWITKIGGIPQ